MGAGCHLRMRSCNNTIDVIAMAAIAQRCDFAVSGEIVTVLSQSSKFVRRVEEILELVWRNLVYRWRKSVPNTTTLRQTLLRNLEVLRNGMVESCSLYRRCVS